MVGDSDRTRREYLSAAGAAGLVGLAGCMDAFDDEATAGGERDEAAIEEPEDEAQEDVEADVQEGPIPMGSILPITGDLEAFGEGMQAAVELAVEHVNDAGGPLDREIELHTRDSETRAEAAVNRYESLVAEQDIVGFVGAASSGASAPLAERVAGDGVMQVSNASTSPVLAELGYDNGTKFFARTAPNDAQQGIVMGRILNEHVEAETAAWLYIDNPYGEGLAERGSEMFSGETTAMIGYDPDAADYTSTLDQVFADDPDAAGFVGYPGNGVTIMRQWDEGGYGGEWVLSEGVNTVPDFFEPLGDVVEGMFLASPHPEETDGADRYEEEMGDRDTLFAAHAYDALFLQALALEAAGEASGRAIAENILDVSRAGDGAETDDGMGADNGTDADNETAADGGTEPEADATTVTVGEFEEAKELLAEDEEINYEGASSPVDMNENLEPLNQFAIMQVTDGKPEVVETIPREEFEGELD